MSVAPVQQLIAFLRTAHDAPRDELARLAQDIDRLPLVRINEPNLMTSLLATSSRAIVKQMQYAAGETLPALRMAVLSLSDAIAGEVRLDLEKRPHRHSQPYYLKDGD